MDAELKTREARVRRRAKRMGLQLRKDRSRKITNDLFGSHLLVDEIGNAQAFRADFPDLMLDRVEAWLDEHETTIVGQLPPYTLVTNDTHEALDRLLAKLDKKSE